MPEIKLVGMGLVNYQSTPVITEEQRLLNFRTDLRILHEKLYAGCGLTRYYEKLIAWASEIGRAKANQWDYILPVDIERDTLLRILEEDKSNRLDILYKEEIIQELRELKGKPEPDQLNQISNYKESLLAYCLQIADSIKHGQRIYGFNMHFDPGASLLAVKNWPHRFEPQLVERTINDLGQCLNDWYR